VIRIIAGEAKGRKLRGPKGQTFRPTTGRVKEFLFSYLGDIIHEGWLLDLFSGSGAVGLEALSRGTPGVVFVEQSSSNLKLLRKNIDLCGYSDRVRIIRGDVFSILKRQTFKSGEFSTIIADPPFKMNFRERIVAGVERSRALRHDGLLIIEHEMKDEDSGNHGMRLMEQRRFGHCFVSVYQGA
jgi:16S rRNA (guanine(966)-N(2))-methyltransferase RsmD